MRGTIDTAPARVAERAAPASASPAPSAAPTEPSRQAAAKKAETVVDGLNSLSVDIARAIDHDASVELWERYRRGERDIFTRRLYTLKGQQTFDETKRKYQNDAEFRAIVDHYCNDFEALIRDIARTDKAATQQYLTSDTGKVYTMLAHASGRLR